MNTSYLLKENFTLFFYRCL